MEKRSKFNSSIALLFRTHPEFGALVGLVLVFVVFCFTATRFLSAGIVTVASELGIVAAGITFLMITGEFDRRYRNCCVRTWNCGSGNYFFDDNRGIRPFCRFNLWVFRYDSCCYCQCRDSFMDWIFISLDSCLFYRID